MNELEIQEIEAQVAVSRLLEKPNGAIQLFEELLYAFNEREKALKKKENNLWVVVKSLKQEHLEELKKIIIPEVFENLGL